MPHAATQPTPITGKSNKSKPADGITSAGPASALPNREKAIQILSKSIYKELRENGYETKQIVALASEIISLVTTDIGDGPLA
jgi:hypothetical protein